MAELTYTVTVASGNLYGGGTGNVFYLDGARNSTGPGTVSWVSGATLRFDQSDASNNNHPLIFSTNTSTSGIISSGITYYLDGASNQTNYTNTTTFNAATTRYIEVTPSSETDFYYLCYIHGIGMGGVFDITQNTWGAKTWGFGTWNLLGDQSASATGVNVTSAVSSVTYFPSVGWGALTWGSQEWGEFESPEAAVTGISIGTFAIGTESVTANANIIPTGASMTSAVGDEVAGTSAEAPVTGQSMTSSRGTVFAGELVTVEVTSPSNDPWGNETWGNGLWGIGDGISLVSGVEVGIGEANVSLTGQGMSSSLGTIGQASIYSLSGTNATTSQGSAFGGELTIVEVTSPSNDPWGNDTWGNSLWGNGDGNTLLTGVEIIIPSVDVISTGQSLTTNVSSVSVTADANTGALTGLSTTFSLGTAVLDANTIASPSGISLTPSLASAVAGASAEAPVTGLQINGSVGTININAWAVVDPDITNTWTVIDEAA
tara:strand:+ start:2134 stop:3600 length:1467 start_codon:yes stop_codon:yes gene_type:complete